MNGKKRKIFSIILAVAVVAGIIGAARYMLLKTEDDICAAAVSNLSGNLSVVSITADALMSREAENLQTIADYAAKKDDPKAWIDDYCLTGGMAAMVMTNPGEAQNVENDSLSVPLDALDFDDGRTLDGLPVSKSYQDESGQWLYAMSCPVEKDGQSLGTLYAEITWKSIESGLPSRVYSEDSVLLLMDGLTDNVIVPASDTNLTQFSDCNNLGSVLDVAGIEDASWRDIFYQNKQDGMSVLFQYNLDGIDEYIYMWPVEDGSFYLFGLVPADEIMQEIPLIRHTIRFIIAAAFLVSAIVIAIILVGTIWRQKIQNAREAEREIHNQQLQEALDYAKAANASKTMFLSNMSHDIRTPMNAIIGFSSLLAGDPSNETKVREYTQKITASSQHLMNLINEILDISKIESGNVVLNIENFSVKQLIGDIELMTRPMMETKHQVYTISIGELHHDVLLGDATRLTQIIVNLLTNASKYTYANGRIDFRIASVKVSDKFERLRFEVEDTGIGMSKAYQKIIFEPFTRAESSTTNKIQGTGLGMAITKNIVDMMGGTIEIQSEEGRGSLFTVEIAFRIPESDAADLPEPSMAAAMNARNAAYIDGTLEGAHLLVVEDNVLNVEIITALLEEEGVQCDIAENGLEAVQAFENHEPGTYDAILMDVMMPVMDGYEATGAIRRMKRPDAAQIPIIAITANAFTEDIKKALKAGMNAHLSKPLNRESLRKVLLPLIKSSVQ